MARWTIEPNEDGLAIRYWKRDGSVFECGTVAFNTKPSMLAEWVCREMLPGEVARFPDGSEFMKLPDQKARA